MFSHADSVPDSECQPNDSGEHGGKWHPAADHPQWQRTDNVSTEPFAQRQ